MANIQDIILEWLEKIDKTTTDTSILVAGLKTQVDANTKDIGRLDARFWGVLILAVGALIGVIRMLVATN
jgi:hypothetical protein